MISIHEKVTQWQRSLSYLSVKAFKANIAIRYRYNEIQKRKSETTLSYQYHINPDLLSLLIIHEKSFITCSLITVSMQKLHFESFQLSPQFCRKKNNQKAVISKWYITPPLFILLPLFGENSTLPFLSKTFLPRKNVLLDEDM